MPWYSLGVLTMELMVVPLMPPLGLSALVIMANAPPKMIASTSTTMSRVFHQLPFFFFLGFLPLPLPCGLLPGLRGGLPPAPVRLEVSCSISMLLCGFWGTPPTTAS